MRRIFCISTFLAAVGVSELFCSKAISQYEWEPITPPKIRPFKTKWGPTYKSDKDDTSQINWEVIPTHEGKGNTSKEIIWELLDKNNAATIIDESQTKLNSNFEFPSSLEEAEAVLNRIPLKPGDYQKLLNISYVVPTALVLKIDEWRLRTSSIYTSGTKNKNYAMRFDYGYSNRLQIAGFYSQTDNGLNAQIKGVDIHLENFWEVFGVAARWKLLTDKNFSLALNSSIERWNVGRAESNSGQRVDKVNITGSFSIPLTWQLSREWQFTFAPGISFLPSTQDELGQFYGNNLYVAGGLLWKPNPKLGLTTSIAHPLGNGNNNFDKNRQFSRVPVISGGVNWHLNPRIALQGLLTNGFGATPATALLTLPANNSLGYSASFIFTADAPDTPQAPLTSRQRSLSHGGLTVNTALVPPNNTSLIKIGVDNKGNSQSLYGYSISNIFQVDFYRSENNNIPQLTTESRTFANNGAVNWRGSGKAVISSPLRGDPIWSAIRVSLGHKMNQKNNTYRGYLFAETPLTLEVNPIFTFNLNP